MQNTINRANILIKTLATTISVMLWLAVAHFAYAGEPAQNPVFLTAQAQPLLMLNMSKDHQLYFRLYDDYADITSPSGGIPDKIADITFNNNFDYYGYFDSYRCYTYNATNTRFEPSTTASKTCTNMWSGNFLNWATMTRIDAIRKILYGGFRKIDSTSNTVLERSYLPSDTHSFAKFYNGSDLASLVPTSVFHSSGITLCNTTDTAQRYSQNATEPPLIKVARGDYSLWANNERWQCKWSEQQSASNGNVPATSGLNAAAGNPSSAATGSSSYVARVQTCVTGRIGDDEGCKVYSTATGAAQKPTGLLQEYGTSEFEANRTIKQKAAVLFGLMTGSYDTSKSGGVLRKAAGSLDDEIDDLTGQFKTPPTNSIINTLDLLRIYGYDTTSGLYMGAPRVIPNTVDGGWYVEPQTPAGSDNCGWIGAAVGTDVNNYPRAGFDNTRCSNWGNPQAEIYLESLRYLAGAQPTSTFAATDTSFIGSLNSVTSWVDPITTTAAGNYCAPLNVLMFNASVTSYDADELATSSAIGLANVSVKTDEVGTAEGIVTGNNFFIGQTPTNTNQLCTAKNVANLSAITGICPEAPRLEGGYQMAGLAYHARSVGIRTTTVAGETTIGKVKTYAVAMAPATPKVSVRVDPTSTTNLNEFTIIPACRNTSSYATRDEERDTSCAIIDFKIVAQTATTGTLYVDWEDMEQGSDFDQDMWGTIKYVINPVANTLAITTYVAAQSSNNAMGFGYVISGTTSDGFKVNSGINGFTMASTGCVTACNVGAVSAAQTYTLGTSTEQSLKDPLYYAAKWGGYDDDDATVAAITASTAPNYFFATDPRKLQASLKTALDKVSKSLAASATAASSSTRLDAATLVYQAIFSSSDWSGQIKAYQIEANGSTRATPTWSTDTTLGRTGRSIYTYDGGTTRSLVKLSAAAAMGSTIFTALSTDATGLRAALKLTTEGASEVNAEKRFAWLLGSATDEISRNAQGAVSGTLRPRTFILGDVVNSTPALAGGDTQHYEELPASYGADSYLAYVETKKARTPVLYVGANDGMLHAFNAKFGNEIFAYIPRGAYSKLAALSSPTYSHQFIVDGSVTVGDAFVQLAGETAKSWHTIVVGALGAGGRGAFALDVTNPDSAPKVIFDISDTDTTIPTYKADLGFNSSKIFIVPVKASAGASRWSIVFGNGTNSVNGYAKLITIDPESSTATVIDTKAKMLTGADLLANGLSGVSLLPDGNGIYTYAYAGDMMGNMWKFDLSSNVLSAWKVAYGTALAPAPLIKVIDPSGIAQPITAAPTIGKNALKLTSDTIPVPSNMIYFGTGKLSETTDKTTTQIQSLYAILDSGSAIPALTIATRTTVLHQKTIATQTLSLRTISNDKTPATGVPTVDWATKKGWFLDLTFGATASGERIIAKPLLLFDRVLINTFIPSSYQCGYGGTGWLMELTGVGDKFIGYDLLGTHGNHILDNVVLGNLIAIFGSKKVEILGSGLKPGINGSIEGFLRDKPASAYGRMSWRQLK
ncbi:MAG: PilC/PilY family type IV pilus protein [Pseudomonadota bacterium]